MESSTYCSASPTTSIFVTANPASEDSAYPAEFLPELSVLVHDRKTLILADYDDSERRHLGIFSSPFIPSRVKSILTKAHEILVSMLHSPLASAMATS
jgi:hypothetical protein